MDNEILGYVFCLLMTAGLFGVIWILSKLLSILSDRILPEPDEEWKA